MIDKELENPFPTTTYHGERYFCDRISEKERLFLNMNSGNSTTLMAIRRMGKTGLLHHVLSHLPENRKGVYVDILETENLTQFLNLLTTNILKTIPQKSSMGRKIWDFIKSLRPIITFDSLSGEPQASFDVKPQEIQSNIASVLQFLESQEDRIIIAIDEFQQILSYPETNTDAWLRTRIQQLKNVQFIFSGSQQHLMNELFLSPQRPFYRSTQMMKLEKIDNPTYCEFIVKQFADYKKEIDQTIASEILDWTNTHTYYVQQLCNRVFEASKKKVKTETWKLEAYNLLKEQENVFFNYRNMLTSPQWNLLKAIAHEAVVTQPTANAFIQKYKLGSSATVLRSLNTLLLYELVYYDYSDNGEKFYSVYDVWFQRWSQSRIG